MNTLGTSMDWVFQFNPKRFDLAALLERGEASDWWAMNQGRADVSPGDQVYFWQTGVDARLLALGQVVSPAYEKESEYGRFRVDVGYRFKIVPPLTRAEALQNPILRQFGLFKGAMGTNCAIRDMQVSDELNSVLRDRLVPISKGIDAVAPSQFKSADEAIKRTNEETLQQVRRCITEMDPAAFEKLIAALLGKIGYQDVLVTGRSGDGGIDVRATYAVPGVANIQTCVQAKRQQSVGRPTVQKLRGSITSHETGLLVTSGHFTAEAIEEARNPHKSPIALMNGHELANLLVENQIGAQVISVQLFKPKLQELSVEHLSALIEPGAST
ncbi:MAG TPA: restriction endonuclease [Rhizomicrobium sp.]|nr:restriction endonuclease [Rhizomicrobium sp.]